MFKYFTHSSPESSLSPPLFPLLHSPFSIGPRLSVSPSPHFPTHCAPLCTLSLSSHSLSSLFLSLANPSIPTRTFFFAHFISTSRPLCLPLSASLSFPPARLSLSSALQLSSVSTIFSPVQSGSAEWSSSTKQTVWTAHNFASFDSD